MTVNIVGAGLSGLSAAIHLAMAGVSTRLISSQPSERAQSVLAAGGINGVLNTMGEDDRTEYHFQDTMRAGCDIADPEAVRNLTESAPDVLHWMADLGMPFQRSGDVIQQRNFGGQKKKRTAYAKSSTGKALMTALIDETRKWEAEGMITRYFRHDFVELILEERPENAISGKRPESGAPGKRAESGEDYPAEKICRGVVVRDNVTGEVFRFYGPVLMACGGMNGLFPGRTTGTTANTADAAAELFSEGVVFSNLEMIQYHPTTLKIPGKCLLVSEAARGEGGRLFILRGGEKWYFMEEKYPELGNLMPRDVVSREEYFVLHDPSCGDQVYIDCTGLSREIWKKKLSDLRQELIYYTGLDPAKSPIPIEPGIHYFMGGIDTDAGHRTNISGLYASGECCSLYHGANRLGGNSTLGAIYGGKKAAETIAEELPAYEPAFGKSGREDTEEKTAAEEMPASGDSGSLDEALGEILYASLGVVRDERTLDSARKQLKEMLASAESRREQNRMMLGMAMLESAIFRKESRGAQYRSDYPDRDENLKGMTAARYHTADAGAKESSPVSIWLKKAGETIRV